MMGFKKNVLAIIFALSSLVVYSQDAFRVTFNTIITNNTVGDAYKECKRLFTEEPTISITEDKKITGYGFSSLGGIITFGKNNLNGEIEGVIIYTRDDIETKWLNEILSAYFHIDNNGVLINNFNKITCGISQGYGENPMFILCLGKKDLCMQIPMNLP